MPKGVNFFFHGRLGTDPVLKYVGQSEAPLVNLRVAVNMGKDKETEWVDCFAFGDTALQIADQFRKGDKIWIKESTPKTSKWMDKDTRKPREKTQWQIWGYAAAEGEDGGDNQGGGDLPDDDTIPY